MGVVRTSFEGMGVESLGSPLMGKGGTIAGFGLTISAEPAVAISTPDSALKVTTTPKGMA